MSKVTKKAEKMIESMKNDPDLLTQITIWMVENEHDKKYKKCIMCDCAELANTFHGRMCTSCRKLEKHQYYLSKKEKK